MKDILADKNIVLGVCGGIAAYKSAELLRLFIKKGAKVRVMTSKSALKFIGEATLAALSGTSVCSDLFDAETADDGAAIKHIEWAETADAVVIAPATANMVGKLANGIADDALSTFLLAVTAPRFICPSMNTHMYENRAVQRNLDRLEQDGYAILEPGSGSLACGTVGPGRLPEPHEILALVTAGLTPKDLASQKVLVTAGPTHEPLDPVRYIGNPSSGKMGFALATAAADRGADVTLVSGPTVLADPPGVELVRVKTAQEMYTAVMERFADLDILIKSAAVSDFRPDTCCDQKVKKDKAADTICLARNPDILKEAGHAKKQQLLIGFAAETEHLEIYATGKLKEKNLDMIVGNLVTQAEAGFQADTNQVTLFFKDGTHATLPLMEKAQLAHVILDHIRQLPAR
ncbi:MAG: Phosphopantothenoylcysteine decarboxylase (EC 4.1.1.36) / Phosphopantothenoylcysteine synthetase (EC 6.3.2.5) [Olavius algarvensis Delta 4 endosymbiont]|nr:MAG: Phosphopantothenoylcysteine decarboxylase (EC 4.1.1.36) / Phosphopantothenoylcysteine synthetase (EC 6.3.2.5) [Olavius algarvensis Delta 4 endosymbiont]